MPLIASGDGDYKGFEDCGPVFVGGDCHCRGVKKYEKGIINGEKEGE